MIENLITGIRELRTGLTTGFMILYSFFLIVNKFALSNLESTYSIDLIFSLIGNTGKIIIISLIAYLIGVSYLYWLETMVNKLHKWSINHEIKPNSHKIKKYYYDSINPISNSAKNRLLIKLQKFYNEEGLSSNLSKKSFIGQNFNDILWMDGRLEDNKTTNDFIRLNTEAFFRMGIGLLLPLVIFATIIELNFHPLEYIILLIFSTISAHWLIIQGFYLHKKSTSMIAHHIADGKFLTPTMANAKSEKQKNDIEK